MLDNSFWLHVTVASRPEAGRLNAQSQRKYMSYNSHQRKIFDDSIALKNRASHARSCALHVANRLGVDREYVIDLVKQKTGISLHFINNAADLIVASEALETLRRSAR